MSMTDMTRKGDWEDKSEELLRLERENKELNEMIRMLKRQNSLLRGKLQRDRRMPQY